jgi:hypothetical protein
MKHALFVIASFSAFWIALAAANIFLAGREPWRRALAAVAGFPLVTLALVLILGSAGKLSADVAVPAVAVIAAAMGIVWLVCRRRRAPVDSALPSAPLERGDPLEDWLLRLAVALLGLFGGLLALRACLLGTGFFSDDLSFHAAAPAHWIQDGGFSVVPHSWHAYHPYNAETLACWLMLPLRADGYASLTGLYWSLLASCAIVALHRLQGFAASTTVLSLALFLASPQLVAQTRTFSAVDLAGLALILAAIPFALPSTSQAPRESRLVDATYCGLLLGCAAGCKVSFAPVAVLLLGWWLLSRGSSTTLRARLGNGTAFAIAAAATGAYWYARCAILTGNPLFPAEIGPFTGPMTKEIANHTRMLSWILAAPADLGQWAMLVERHLDYPLGFALLTIAGYCAAAVSRLRRASTADPRSSSVTWLLLLGGGVLLVLYPALPMSAAGFPRHETLRVSLRYVFPAFGIGLVLFPSLCEPTARRRAFWWTLALLALVTAWPGPGGRASSAAIGTSVLALAALVLWPRLSALEGRLPCRPLLPAALCLIFLAALAAWAPYKQRATDRSLHGYTVNGRPVGAGWRALEDLPEGSRVTAYGDRDAGEEQDQLSGYYPLFGRRLQLVPVFLEADGSPGVPLHVRWATERRTFWQTRQAGDWDFGLWPDKLDAQGIEYVLTSRAGGERWPPQHQLLADSGRAQVVYQDGDSTLWRLVRKP